MPIESHLVDLRNLLARRFPHVPLSLPERPAFEWTPTGVNALDALLGGGLPRGACTEMVARGPGSGSAEVIHELLRELALNRQFLALVDGMGSFDPGPVDPVVLTRLLWVRCQKATEALQAVDLLLRDRNFPVLVLDLKLNSAAELRRIPSSTWFRYTRLLEHNDTTLLVISPHQLVGGATCRVSVDSGLGMDALGQKRVDLLAQLRFELLKPLVDSAQDNLAKAG
jgi:hypothetical protein